MISRWSYNFFLDFCLFIRLVWLNINIRNRLVGPEAQARSNWVRMIEGLTFKKKNKTGYTQPSHVSWAKGRVFFVRKW